MTTAAETVSPESLPDTATQAAIATDVLVGYIPIVATAGVLILMVAWLPLLIRKAPLSLPIACVIVGALIFKFTPFVDYSPHPIETPVLIEKATELIVIISLMGAGLKIDRLFSFKGWNLTLRLLGIVMPLCIIALALIGHGLLGLGLASAILLGACLAPTDPVLAADISIEDPHSAQDSEARFALTSEAGLNDALAFPFVHLAIALSVTGLSTAMLGDWFIDKVLIKLTVGTVAGLASGWLLGVIVYRLPKDTQLSRTGDGFVALGATLLIYGATELLHGYGFLAVFLAGLMLRQASREHDFNDRLHDFADETERLLMMILLIFFGGMLANGGLIELFTLPIIIFSIVALLIVRPIAGWLGMIGSDTPKPERSVIAFFGIRGLGSVYYLAYALNHGEFEHELLLWQTLAFIVVLSIFMHGVLATPAMAWLDRQKGKSSG